MKVNLFLLFNILLFLSSCEQEEPKSYFPFQQYLSTELKQIDSLPIAIFKYSTKNSKTDTSIIEKQQFRALVVGLMDIDLQNEKLTDDYQELVLEDAAIRNISISYSTEKKQYPIKQLQLNVEPGTTQVKSVYMERTDVSKDIVIVRKLLWNSNKGLTITSLYYKDKQLQHQLTEKYNWTIQ